VTDLAEPAPGTRGIDEGGRVAEVDRDQAAARPDRRADQVCVLGAVRIVALEAAPLQASRPEMRADGRVRLDCVVPSAARRDGPVPSSDSPGASILVTEDAVEVRRMASGGHLRRVALEADAGVGVRVSGRQGDAQAEHDPAPRSHPVGRAG